MTSGDGIYTVNLPVLSDSPGYYMLRLMLTAIDGQARIHLTTVDDKRKGNLSKFLYVSVLNKSFFVYRWKC